MPTGLGDRLHPICRNCFTLDLPDMPSEGNLVEMDNRPIRSADGGFRPQDMEIEHVQHLLTFPAHDRRNVFAPGWHQQNAYAASGCERPSVLGSLTPFSAAQHRWVKRRRERQ